MFKIPHRIKKILPLIFLLVVLSVGSFLRLYRIREYAAFLGDEGRDVLVVKRMIVDHKLTLLGPITSVGNIYMGPVYYYFMVPFLWLWKFDPVGPAIMVALFSVATIYLIYKLGSDFFQPAIGLMASFLYAISPLTIIYGRSSWNPNVVPFFSLLVIYSLMRAFIKNQKIYFVVAGLSLGVLVQLHYVTLIFIPVLVIFAVIFRKKLTIRDIILFIISFVTSYSPFILFEIRHDFVNTKAVWRFIWQQNSQAEGSILSTISDVVVRLFWRLTLIKNAEVTKVFLAVAAVSLWKTRGWWRKNNRQNIAMKILLIWFLAGVFSYGFYRGVIYDYYLASLFPLPFLLSAIVLFLIWKINNIGKILSGFIFLLLILFNLEKSPLQIEPNNMIKNTETIARHVFELTGGKPYNFALIAGRNSDHAYRYFLEIWGAPPRTIENPVNDPDRKTVTDQLWVVCEEKVCQPLGHPLWEIAGFGQAEITGKWHVVTVDIFRLVHFI